METCETTVDEGTWLVLSTDADLYRFLRESDPR